ncbi:MAG: PAS domain-containing protein [Deltaproteobacteria bacterium]|nr:PAS domain-containing protein [Deltaproteobacteria bacterium]
MRFGLRAKEAVAITFLTFLVVATTTLIHLSQLTRVVVREASAQAELIARQIYAQSSRPLSRASGRNPWDVLRRDRDLRNLLDASVGYSSLLLYAMIADQTGTTILHSEREKEGSATPERPSLQKLLSLDPARRFLALYRGGRIYEATLPMTLNRRPFGSVRLGISTSLLRRELNASLKQSLALAGLALPVAWLVAMGLANLILRPIRKLVREMDRLRQGEFNVGGDLGRDDELGELASQVQLLGQQLHTDRLKMLSEKAHLEQAVDRLEDGILFLNQDRRILFFNKAAEAVVGRPLEQAVGYPLENMLELSHPLSPLVEKAFQQGAAFRNATIALPADGASREWLVSVFPVAEAQKAMGAMILLKDLESIKTLQSLISYSAKLTALGGLTSGVAHEVKNPLNAMMIHLELLKEKLDAPSGDVQQSLDVLDSEIRRLDRVVQGFLKFVRPQELSLKPVDLNALLTNVAALLEAEWEKAGIRFTFQLDPTLPLVTADEELLQQAFLNILLNACQAMPTGGTVNVVTERDKREFVKVSITDEGLGIPPEDLEKIFKLYYTTKPDGSGIGLSLVYRIAQMHDGRLDVVSEVGRGTTMIVRLPVS